MYRSKGTLANTILQSKGGGGGITREASETMVYGVKKWTQLSIMELGDSVDWRKLVAPTD